MIFCPSLPYFESVYIPLILRNSNNLGNFESLISNKQDFLFKSMLP